MLDYLSKVNSQEDKPDFLSVDEMSQFSSLLQDKIIKRLDTIKKKN